MDIFVEMRGGKDGMIFYFIFTLPSLLEMLAQVYLFIYLFIRSCYMVKESQQGSWHQLSMLNSINID